MATRRNIKNAFLSEIESAVDGTTYPNGGSNTFSKDDVYLSGMEDDTAYPRVVYSEFGFPVSYNDGSDAAPSEYTKNGSGEVTAEVYYDYAGLRFDVIVVGSELDKEPIYEAIRERFAQFDTWRDKTDLHADVQKIDTRGVNSPDDTDTENTTRLDVFSVEVVFKRKVDYTGTPIRKVQTIGDADNDGTADMETYDTT